MLRRPEVFDDEHLPRQLLHREPETTQLLEALDPGPDGDRRGHAVISGPSGVGKTVLTRYCGRTLERERSIDRAYVRCLGATTGTILRETIADLRAGPDKIAHNRPMSEVINVLHAAVEDTAIVVLDESDDLPDRAVEQLTDVRGVSIVMICHEPEQWYSTADPEIRGRLKAGAELRLERYGVAELADILERRAEVGLDRAVITRAQLERIADDVAGVARLGIQTLRCAAELATDAGQDRITDADLAPARQQARRVIRKSNLQSLPFRYQYLYAVIRDAEEISSSEIYVHYEAVGDRVWYNQKRQPPGRRAIRDHLSKLQQYDLITTDSGMHRATEPSLEPLHKQVPRAPLAPRNRH